LSRRSELRHVSFVRPNLGEGLPADAMTPLVFSILRARTPPEIATTLLDERVERFQMAPTDLVAMTVETFTARRAYEIAALYRRAGVPVVVGGHHPSMLPDEALLHADAVVVGDAEGAWETVLADARAGRLQRLYRSKPGQGGPPVYDRSIFAGKTYAPISLVQVGRGCRFNCDFCSIHAFYGTYHEQRDPAHVVAELRTLPRRRLVFFVDDNLYGNRDDFERLLRALVPLRRRWCCQITIDVARDAALLDLMARAGCVLALVGFESLDRNSLIQMRKKWSHVAGSYEDVIRRFHARGIMIYGTFVFGYDADVAASFDRAAAFARDQSFCIANFNPLTPMPGTALYDRLRHEGRLLRDRWWLDPSYRYGDSIFVPRSMTTAELSAGPMRARRHFYSWPSILSRAARGTVIWRDGRKIATMLAGNWISRREIFRKQGRPLAPAVAEPASAVGACS
jgi:radical SAM superfamily enzyme YgiQ (UPF0313 family)